MQDRKKKEFLISLEHRGRHEAECQLCGAFTTMCSVTGRPAQKHCSLSCQSRHCGIRRTEPTRHSPLSLVHSTHADAKGSTLPSIQLHTSFPLLSAACAVLLPPAGAEKLGRRCQKEFGMSHAVIGPQHLMRTLSSYSEATLDVS